MTYNPRQTFEPGRGSIYSSYKPPSRSNANKQAASSMASVGIGGLSGKPTTSAAKRIQDKFRKETQKDNNRNTGGYDPVGGGSVDDPGYKGPGLGSNPNTGNDKDDSSSQDTFIDTLMKKVKSSFNFAGGTSQNDEPTDPDPVSVYTADVFASPVIQVGYENPNDMRSGEEIATDIARMFDRSKDKGYYQYSTEAGSRYDEVPAASANKNLEVNKTRSAVESLLKDVLGTKAKEYKIKKGDTLSEIALREGVTVDDLVKVNGIENKDRIYADETLIIPNSQEMEKAKDIALRVTTSGDEMERFEGEVDKTDPDQEFSQSTISEKDREYFEEDTSELNNPQTQKSIIPTDPMSAQEDSFERKGIMSRPVSAQQNNPNIDLPESELSRLSNEPIREGTAKEPKNEVIVNMQQALTDLGYRPNGVDGKYGGGTRRAIRKFQKSVGLPVTGKPDMETQQMLKAKDAPKYFDPPLSVAETKKILDAEGNRTLLETFSENDFDNFAEAVAGKESSNRYNIHGGATKNGIPQYDGKYQLGRGAKADVKAALTDPEEKAKLVHTIDIGDARTAFVEDNELQEKAFKIYTQQNHEHLTRYSKEYRESSDKDKLAVLGYAHNQGATAAEEWLYTRVSGSDAFGTKGDEYTTLVKNALGERDTPN